MAIREIAARWEFACDACRGTTESPSKSRPARWVDLHILRDAYDFQGVACADASIRLLLCPECAGKAIIAINGIANSRWAKPDYTADCKLP